MKYLCNGEGAESRNDPVNRNKTGELDKAGLHYCADPSVQTSTTGLPLLQDIVMVPEGTSAGKHSFMSFCTLLGSLLALWAGRK